MVIAQRIGGRKSPLPLWAESAMMAPMRAGTFFHGKLRTRASCQGFHGKRSRRGSLVPKKAPPIFLAVLLALGVVFLAGRKARADGLEELRLSLPAQIKEWSAEAGEDRFFDEESIFTYINGAAELYRAYNMRGCFSRRYSNGKGATIVLDLFDMGSSEDAFGVFTHDQDGEVLEIGQGALYRAGWLSFWKGRFFVSVYADGEQAETVRGVKELGKAVASRIKTEGSKPRILSHLPQRGVQPKTVRYLHHHVILNAHFYLSDDNLLHLGPSTHAVLATYKRSEGDALLLLVMYPESALAAKAHASFLNHYLPDRDSGGIALLENGKYSGAALKNKVLIVVFDAGNRELAETLLKESALKLS